MRRVELYTFRARTTGLGVEQTKRGEGWFHGFGVDFEEFDGGPGNYTVAIVERDDGTIESVPLNFVRFLDPVETEAA